jgi:hypothetical protein
MVFIRILNVIVGFIINVLRKIKCVKRNVQMIKSLVVIQANVDQGVMYQCRVGHIFLEVHRYHVGFSWKFLLKYLFLFCIDHRNVGFLISFGLAMIFFVSFDL